MPSQFHWTLSSDDKTLYIRGPANFAPDITIDHDDVAHGKVEAAATKLCKLLNKHWFTTPSEK